MLGVKASFVPSTSRLIIIKNSRLLIAFARIFLGNFITQFDISLGLTRLSTVYWSTASPHVAHWLSASTSFRKNQFDEKCYAMGKVLLRNVLKSNKDGFLWALGWASEARANNELLSFAFWRLITCFFACLAILFMLQNKLTIINPH